jgi:hypothetical protein
MSLGLTALILCGMTISTSKASIPLEKREEISQEKNEIQIFKPIKNTSPRVGGDSYENNDNFNDAVKLSPDNFYSIDSYDTQISATLDKNSIYSDVDYFHFECLTDSNVDFLVSTKNDEYSFDINIYTYDYSISNDNSDNAYRNHKDILPFDSSPNKEKSFSGIVKPGTYFIVLECQESQSIGSVVSYDMELRIDKFEGNYESQSIDAIRFSQNLKAAVWKSDYFPIDFGEPINPGLDLTYYDPLSNGTNEPDYALDELMRISHGDRIHLANYYIWGLDIRAALAYFAQEMSSAIQKEFSDQDKIRIQMTTTIDTLKLMINVACKAISLAGKFTPFSFQIDCESFAINKAACYLLDIILINTLPKTNITKVKLLRYFSTLRGLLQKRNGDDSDRTVIEIPFYYELSKNESIIPNKVKHSISTDASLDAFLDAENNLFEGDSIGGDVPETYYCRGKVFGITLDDTGENVKYDMISNFDYIHSTAISLSLDYASSFPKLYYKEYYWFKFISPSNGNYSFFTSGDSSNKKDVRVDMYSRIDDGYGIQDRISTNLGGYYIDGVEIGTYCQKSMNKGETIYFKIYSEGENSISSGAFQVREGFRSFHLHDYSDSYSWISLTRHRAFCSCKKSILEGHVVSGNSLPNLKSNSTCLLCHGTASGGFIGPSLSMSSTNQLSSAKPYDVVLKPDGLFYPVKTKVENDILFLSYEDSQSIKSNPQMLQTIATEHNFH